MYTISSIIHAWSIIIICSPRLIYCKDTLIPLRVTGGLVTSGEPSENFATQTTSYTCTCSRWPTVVTVFNAKYKIYYCQGLPWPLWLCSRQLSSSSILTQNGHCRNWWIYWWTLRQFHIIHGIKQISTLLPLSQRVAPITDWKGVGQDSFVWGLPLATKWQPSWQLFKKFMFAFCLCNLVETKGSRRPWRERACELSFLN